MRGVVMADMREMWAGWLKSAHSWRTGEPDVTHGTLGSLS